MPVRLVPPLAVLASAKVPLRLRSRLVVVLLSGAVLSGCAGPAVTADGYRVKTAGTLRVISSALATAKLATDLDLAGRSGLALTDTSISQAESDASSAQSSWASRQPPTDGALRLHDQVTQPIQDAVTVLQDLRIAERRGDLDAVRQARAALDRASGQVEHWIQVVSG